MEEFTSRGSRFPTPGFVIPTCFWKGCRDSRAEDLPVCLAHALIISERAHQLLADWRHPDADLPRPEPPPDPPPPPSFVYYLMVGPSTVKIGVTTDLRQRIVNELRSELQYVVAIEHGDRHLERQRHLEFAAERIGRRENFQLSDRLVKHIGALQSDRDELVQFARTHTRYGPLKDSA